SSALASKATGFPIARIGAKLAVGYRLDELPNDITKSTPASFEPVLDYVVVKFPRFAFEKFPTADPTLGVQMKAVGEVMAIGRTFKQAWQKGLRGLEIDRAGWETGARLQDDGLPDDSAEALRAALRRPTAERPFQLKRAIEAGMSTEELFELTAIDPWFLDQLAELVEAEREYRALPEVDAAALRRMKRLGFSDRQLGRLRGETEAAARERRHAFGIRPTYHRVDTCSGEFPAVTPYLYSSYEDESEAPPSDRPKVVILGSGPNRIGQGIEFDYCCVQAALALKEDGFETIMVNSNPETVSTDFDISDKLYFEPLTLEDTLEIIQRENPVGVIVQLGGQTPLKLAEPLAALGVPILGTTVDAIDRAEDRDRFAELCRKLDAVVPPNGIATSTDEARRVAAEVGYPVVVRPSYVLGGRAMEIVYDEHSLLSYFERAVRASPDHPVLIDRFIEDAFEADVDALADGEDVVIAGVMQHIEDAGVHSGDSACVLPPYRLRDTEVEEIRRLTRAFAAELGVVGLINVQYAIKDGVVYVLEVNPRASRTVPFVSKATGIAFARVAARVMAGKRLADLGLPERDTTIGAGSDFPLPAVAVKEAVFPFNKFDVDVILGPEMRSTGEVMGLDASFGMSFAKAQISAGLALPTEGTVVVTVNDNDKPTMTPIVRRFHELGFRVLATHGTAKYFRARGVPVERIFKVGEGRPNIVDAIISGEIQLLINTPLGKKSQYDDYAMRRAAIVHKVPYCTTTSAASAACDAVIALRSRQPQVRALQEWFETIRQPAALSGS
ncbi:MAG TPA: carbamoyl-phosphate synthase large subunit, partial [Longimicrobiales bacterium]|nr:carbamoyl-phosphate synthase large subunit [Longimicrobiales bacterium]